MGSVNISVKEEAYRFLKSLKAKDESFSEVILKFKERKGNKENLMRFFGVLADKDVDWGEKEKRMNKLRESFNKRLRKSTY